MPSRRSILQTLSLGLATVVTGCGSRTRSGTASSPTPSPTRTVTPSPTASPTPTPEPGWKQAPSMPAQRTEVRGAVLDGTLYVVGGFDNNQRDQGSVFAYNPNREAWLRASLLPSPRHHPGVTVHDGVLYVIGGLSGDGTDWTPHDTVWAFDGDGWETRTPMPTARGAGIAETLDDRIYVVGGSDAETRTHLSLVEVYDPAADEWTDAPSLPYKTQSMGSGVLDRTLYVAGGRTIGVAGGTTFDDFFRFDPADSAWESLPSLPTRRAGYGLAVADDRVWAIGGEIGLNVLNAVDVFDPETGMWTAGPSLPNSDGRHGHVAAAIDGTIYVAGGTFPPGATATDSVIALENLTAST